LENSNPAIETPVTLPEEVMRRLMFAANLCNVTPDRFVDNLIAAEVAAAAPGSPAPQK
jgi:hypothetical protein